MKDPKPPSGGKSSKLAVEQAENPTDDDSSLNVSFEDDGSVHHSGASILVSIFSYFFLLLYSYIELRRRECLAALKDLANVPPKEILPLMEGGYPVYIRFLHKRHLMRESMYTLLAIIIAWSTSQCKPIANAAFLKFRM